LNEDVYKMIDTLHARLDDVRAAVDTLQDAAPEYAKRLDKVDDSLYLIQRDIEKHVASSGESDGSGSGSDDEVEEAEKPGEASSKEEKSFLSDEMKDNLKDAGKTMAGIYRDGKEVVSELSGTMNEIKGLFKFK
jgi:methyl-accepting chemotaxis protein